MSSKARSKNPTFTSKSLKNHSIQTKQESIARSSPKAARQKDVGKFKQKPKNKKSLFKSVSKLNSIVQKIQNRLLRFGSKSSSNLITLSSSTHTVSQAYKKNSKLQIINTEHSKSTLVLLQHICKQSIYTNQQQVQQNSLKDIINKQNGNNDKIYRQLLDSALSKPHCLKKLNTKCNQKRTKNRKSNDLIQNVRLFKNQQNENWKNINKQLMRYLYQVKQQQRQKELKNVQSQLTKQGISNYKWLQIQDKMSEQIYQSLNSPQIIKKASNFLQALNQIQHIQRNDEPIVDKLRLKNFEIEKYSWYDQQVLSTSDALQCSKVTSEVQYVSINTADLLNQSIQVQQNVQIILNWLLDQFVVQLAKRLDVKRAKIESQNIKIIVSRQKVVQDQQYKQFMSTINQIAFDCQQIRQCQQSGKKISVLISHALIQMAQCYPTLNNNEIKKKLIKSICNRELEINQLYFPQQTEEQQWIKMSIIYQLEQHIWQNILREQIVCIFKQI